MSTPCGLLGLDVWKNLSPAARGQENRKARISINTLRQAHQISHTISWEASAAFAWEARRQVWKQTVVSMPLEDGGSETFLFNRQRKSRGELI